VRIESRQSIHVELSKDETRQLRRLLYALEGVRGVEEDEAFRNQLVIGLEQHLYAGGR